MPSPSICLLTCSNLLPYSCDRFDEARSVSIDLVGCTFDIINSLLYLYAFLHFYNRMPLARRGTLDAIPLIEADDSSSDSLGLRAGSPFDV